MTHLAQSANFVESIIERAANQNDRYGIIFFPSRTPANSKDELRIVAERLRNEGVITGFSVLRNGFAYSCVDKHKAPWRKENSNDQA